MNNATKEREAICRWLRHHILKMSPAKLTTQTMQEVLLGISTEQHAPWRDKEPAPRTDSAKCFCECRLCHAGRHTCGSNECCIDAFGSRKCPAPSCEKDNGHEDDCGKVSETALHDREKHGSSHGEMAPPKTPSIIENTPKNSDNPMERFRLVGRLVEIGEMHGMSREMPFPGLMIECAEENDCRLAAPLLNRDVIITMASPTGSTVK